MAGSNLGARLARRQYPVNSYTLAQWQMFLPLIYSKGVSNMVDVSPALANKYKFDLAGLLQNEFSVPYDLVIPTMLVNGYNTSTDYNGDKYKLYIINVDFCSNLASSIYESV